MNLHTFLKVNLYAMYNIFYLSAFVCPWLDFGLPPRRPQVVWCHWGEIEPFSASLAQDGLVECDRPGKSPLKYIAMAGN